MNQNTQSQNFIVTREGEIDTELSVMPPSFLEAVRLAVQSTATKFTREARLQAQMALFDAWHRTNYRTIRNQLKRQQRLSQFEAKLGLVRVS